MIPTTLLEYYKLHAPIYDITRWGFLFGRNQIYNYFPKLPSGSRILDLGCGTGKITSILHTSYPERSISAIDPSPEMLHKANQKNLYGVQWFNEDYSIDSFQTNTFDLITASYSLSMVEDLEQILKAITRHLTPNGKLLVVDFDETPYTWFSDWMAKNHVHFNHQLFQKIEYHFYIHEKETRKAFGGLYSYSTIKACLRK
ncbi:MAG: class I SAM-dependent methyltransferase [bacterium]|nr:class I SAM-dependent methyltransferase [bacterium]